MDWRLLELLNRVYRLLTHIVEEQFTKHFKISRVAEKKLAVMVLRNACIFWIAAYVNYLENTEWLIAGKTSNLWLNQLSQKLTESLTDRRPLHEKMWLHFNGAKFMFYFLIHKGLKPLRNVPYPIYVLSLHLPSFLVLDFPLHNLIVYWSYPALKVSKKNQVIIFGVLFFPCDIQIDIEI